MLKFRTTWFENDMYKKVYIYTYTFDILYRDIDTLDSLFIKYAMQWTKKQGYE